MAECLRRVAFYRANKKGRHRGQRPKKRHIYVPHDIVDCTVISTGVAARHSRRRTDGERTRVRTWSKIYGHVDEQCFLMLEGLLKEKHARGDNFDEKLARLRRTLDPPAEKMWHAVQQMQSSTLCAEGGLSTLMRDKTEGHLPSILVINSACGQLERYLVRHVYMGEYGELEDHKQRILGVEHIGPSIAVAVAKGEILFMRHPELTGQVSLGYTQMDPVVHLTSPKVFSLEKTNIKDNQVDIAIINFYLMWLTDTEITDLMRELQQLVRRSVVLFEFGRPYLPTNSSGLPKRHADVLNGLITYREWKRVLDVVQAIGWKPDWMTYAETPDSICAPLPGFNVISLSKP